jgi:hypothetical protein
MKLDIKAIDVTTIGVPEIAQFFEPGTRLFYEDSKGYIRDLTVEEYEFLKYHSFENTKLTDGIKSQWTPFSHCDITYL